MMLRRGTVAALLVAALALGCQSGDTPLYQHELTGPIMGTTFTVKVVLPKEPNTSRSEEIDRAIRSALNEVDGLMSTYKPNSEISTFNRSAVGEPTSVSAPTIDVLELSNELALFTGGAFDPSVGPLVEAWGFGTGGTPEELPTAELLASLQERVGLAQISIDKNAGTLTKIAEGVELDLSAVAKGYASDRVGSSLENLGLSRYMAEIGGEIRVAGLNQHGEPWRLAIERPPASNLDSSSPARFLAPQAIIELDAGALATSGDYRNFYEKDGRRYSHTIDPSTGEPVTHKGASVSVVSDTCAEADALATALLVMGPTRGMSFAKTHDIAALFVAYNDRGGLDETVTPAMQRLLSRATSGAPAGQTN